MLYRCNLKVMAITVFVAGLAAFNALYVPLQLESQIILHDRWALPAIDPLHLLRPGVVPAVQLACVIAFQRVSNAFSEEASKGAMVV